MGYRSQVRSLIYGDPDKVDALIAKHSLMGRKGGEILKEVRVYDIKHKVLRVPEGKVPEGWTAAQGWEDVPCRLIDLTGDNWKWYDGYPDVAFWHELLIEAFEEWQLSTEFVRIGEEPGDVVTEYNLRDEDKCPLLGTSTVITDDIDEIGESDLQDCQEGLVGGNA